VEIAHTKFGIHVIFDIILSHSGDVFACENEKEKYPRQRFQKHQE